MNSPENFSLIIFLSIVGILIGLALLPVEISVEDAVAEEELAEEWD